jgi:hypothetical protein
MFELLAWDKDVEAATNTMFTIKNSFLKIIKVY